MSSGIRADWRKLLKSQAETMQRRSTEMKAKAEEAGKQGNAALSKYYTRHADQCESQAASCIAQIQQVEGTAAHPDGRDRQ